MKKITFLALAILLTSCATSTPALKSQSFSHLFQHRSGLIVPAEVQVTDNPNDKCKMEFSDTKGKRQSLALDPGQDVYFLELPAGVYQVTSLSCGRGVFAVENQPPWARFVVNDGSLSYFSFIQLHPNKEIMVKYPSRQESLEAFQKTWKALSPSDRQRLVFAMDGRKMNEKMQDIQKDVSFHFQSPHPPANSSELKEPVIECYRKETIQNHTLLGTTEYQATYQNGKLLKMTPGSRSANTYSPQFFECIERALSDYRPPGSVSLKIGL